MDDTVQQLKQALKRRGVERFLDAGEKGWCVDLLAVDAITALDDDVLSTHGGDYYLVDLRRGKGSIGHIRCTSVERRDVRYREVLQQWKDAKIAYGP